jgi:hypothetical protein
VFGIFREAIAEVSLHFSEAIIHRTRGQFFVEPIHYPADIIHARAEPECFANESAPTLVEIERDGVRQHRLSRPEINFKARRNLEFLDRHFAILRCRRDERLRFRLAGS